MTLKPYFGAHGDEEIPVLIPNTEVKLVSGDYTATSGKLARCRIIQITLRTGGFLFGLALFVSSANCKITSAWRRKSKRPLSQRRSFLFVDLLFVFYKSKQVPIGYL